MGAIKLTSQSQLQTRKRGAREAGTALVTLVTVLIQLSPAARAPAGCGTAACCWLSPPFVPSLICAQPAGPARGCGLVNKAVGTGTGWLGGLGTGDVGGELSWKEACLPTVLLELWLMPHY